MRHAQSAYRHRRVESRKLRAADGRSRSSASAKAASFWHRFEERRYEWLYNSKRQKRSYPNLVDKIEYGAGRKNCRNRDKAPQR